LADLLQHAIQAQANGLIVRNAISNLPSGANSVITALSTDVFVCPIVHVVGKLVDSSNQATVLNDFTGASGIEFAVRVAGFSAADHQDLFRLVAAFVMRRRAGLE
jgi:hypothetical protein